MAVAISNTSVVRRVAQRNGYQIKRGFEHNEKYFSKGFYGKKTTSPAE